MIQTQNLKSRKISVICQERKKTFIDMQRLLNFTSQAPFLRKLMEVILQPNEGVGQKKEDSKTKKQGRQDGRAAKEVPG